MLHLGFPRHFFLSSWPLEAKILAISRSPHFLSCLTLEIWETTHSSDIPQIIFFPLPMQGLRINHLWVAQPLTPRNPFKWDLLPMPEHICIPLFPAMWQVILSHNEFALLLQDCHLVFIPGLQEKSLVWGRAWTRELLIYPLAQGVIILLKPRQAWHLGDRI